MIYNELQYDRHRLKCYSTNIALLFLGNINDNSADGMVTSAMQYIGIILGHSWYPPTGDCYRFSGVI